MSLPLLIGPAAVAGVASRAALAGAAAAGVAHVGKKVYDAIVDDDSPDEAFAPLIQPRTDAPPPPPPDDDEENAPTDIDPDVDFAPLMDAPPSVTPASAPPIIPDGPWKYQVLAGGVVKIVGAPPGSSAVGMVLDPVKIAALPNGPSKARLTRAYESIKSVSMGKDPLPRLSATKKPAPPPPAAAAPPVPVPEPAAASAPPPVEAPAPTPAKSATDGRPFERVREMFNRFYEPGAGADGSGAP